MKLYSRKDNKPLENHLIDEGLIIRSSHIALGVSGGADSVAMLLFFCSLRKKLDLRLSVRHLEHGIRGQESLEDADFTKKLCETLEVPFFSKSVDVPAFAGQNGLSLEEAARKLRYEFLFEGDEDVVAVAHNYEDNAETVLFNLIRGSGIAGLCGMDEKTIIYGKPLIRPFLSVSRTDIEAYLNDAGQMYRTDSTNASDEYSRNAIRNRIVPALKEINPGAISHINEAAESLDSIRDFVFRDVDGILTSISDENKISVDGLKAQPGFIREALVMEWIGKLHGKKDIGRTHYKSVLKLLNSQVESQVDIPRGFVKRGYEYLEIVKRNSSQKDHKQIEKIEPVSLDIEEIKNKRQLFLYYSGYDFSLKVFPYKNKENIPVDRYTKWFDCGKMKNTFFLRDGEKNDYFTINSRMDKKTFARYCIDEKIPREKRGEIPVFSDGDHLLWAVGYRISEGFKVDSSTEYVLEISAKERDDV